MNNDPCSTGQLRSVLFTRNNLANFLSKLLGIKLYIFINVRLAQNWKGNVLDEWTCHNI